MKISVKELKSILNGFDEDLEVFIYNYGDNFHVPFEKEIITTGKPINCYPNYYGEFPENALLFGNVVKMKK